jgi:acetyl esterase/lipase
VRSNILRVLLGSKFAAKVLQQYEKECQGLRNFNVKYPLENVEARWIVEAENRQPEDPIIVYLHGGGYILGIMTSQVETMISMYHSINNPRLSILALDYTLVPEKLYPTPLQEAASLYHQLTEVEKCNRVILVGDSAGGNLAISLMAHIKYPHPQLARLPSAIKPYAAILVSPWVDLDPTYAGSYVENNEKDIISWKAVSLWGSSYCHDLVDRNSVWLSPINSKAGYWEGVLPEDTLTIWGEAEVFRDDCATWAMIAGVKGIVEPRGTHISVFSEVSAGAAADSFVYSKMLSFFKKML